MRRLLIALALLLAAPFSAEATCTFPAGATTWATIGQEIDAGCTESTAETFVIPSTATVTIAAGVTIDFASAAGTITNNGTLVVNGTLKLYNDATGTGTWTVTGDLKSCVSGNGTCTIAGDTASNIYALNTLSDGRYISGGWRLTYTTNAWDGGMAVGDILEYTDIDGDPDNDSPAGALRPFFHISTVTAGSDLIETTYGVGSSVSDYTLAYTEGNTSVGCYVGDTAGAGAGVTAVDIANSDADSVELDQAWSSAIGVTDRSTTISLPTTTLPNQGDHDFIGQWICLAAAGTDANCYLIWDSVDGGGGRDLVRVWPPIKSMDYTAAAKTCTIGWGEPNRTAAGLRGNPLAEFIVFTPARVMGNRPGVSINNTSTGQVNATFANFGPAAGAAGYGVAIHYGADSVVTANERHTWHSGWSGNSSINIADDSHIGITAGATGTVTLDHVLFSHDFEPRHATSASSADADKTSGPHGISNVGNVAVIANDTGCFKIGDACFVNSSSTATRMALRDISCGWIDGRSSACVKPTNAAHTVTVDGMYAANVNSKNRMCDGEGASPTTAGTNCSVDADCTGATDVCVSATGNVAETSQNSDATLTIHGLVGLAGASDGAWVTDYGTAATTGSDNVSVDGGFILDNRSDSATNTTAMAMFIGVNSVKHISMPFGVGLGISIVSTFSNNYAQRLRPSGTAGDAILSFLGNLGAAGAPTLRFENNVLLDLYDGTADDLIAFTDFTIPAGGKLYVNNNKIDRSRLASTTRFVELNNNGTDFGVAASGELIQMRNNAVSGYGELMRCANGTFPASTADLEVTGNAFAPSSGITLGQDTFVTYGCTTANSRSDPINRANDIVNRYRLMGGPVGGYKGPNGVAGYRQTDFLTSLGIESVWVEAGGSGGGGDAPCLGSACGVPNIGSR